MRRCYFCFLLLRCAALLLHCGTKRACDGPPWTADFTHKAPSLATRVHNIVPWTSPAICAPPPFAAAHHFWAGITAPTSCPSPGQPLQTWLIVCASRFLPVGQQLHLRFFLVSGSPFVPSAPPLCHFTFALRSPRHSLSHRINVRSVDASDKLFSPSPPPLKPCLARCI